MSNPENNPSSDLQDDNARRAGALIERPGALPSTQPIHGWLTDEYSIDLRHYWAIILRRKWTILIFAAIVVAVGMTATYLIAPIYRASGTLLVDTEETKIVQYQETTPGRQADWNSYEYLQTQLQVLKSRAVAERVVTELNLTEHPMFSGGRKVPVWRQWFPWMNDAQPQREAPIASALADRVRAVAGVVQDGLSVEQVSDTRLVRVSFDSPDAKLAAQIVNSISSVFINMNLARRMDATSYAKTFLQDRLEQVQAKLESSEKALVEFARREELIKTGEIDEEGSVDTQVMLSYAAALARAQQERIKMESLHASLQGASVEGLPEVVESKIIQGLKERKNKLEADYQEGLKTFKPAYPRMQQIKSQIDETQEALNAELNKIRAIIKARYQAALAQEAALANKLKDSRRGILNEQERSIKYNILKREVDTNRQLFEGLLQRMKEVGVAGGVGINNISVVDKAEVPDSPYTPDPVRNLMIAIFLGLAGGIGLAFLFEHLDDTVKQVDEVERQLGLPVLGVVPFVKTDGGTKLHHENYDTRSHFAEAHRSLRTALLFSTPEGMPRVLMVTSTSMGEGKSTTALSLAMQITQTGKRVLIIDGDLRKASLHKSLELDNEVGLTNYLAGNSKPVEITITTEVPNLFAIVSGPLPPNPAELIGSNKMVSLLTLAREKFDHVIIDGSPVLELADAPLLGSIADATVMVIESGGTRRGFAKEAIKRLRATRTYLVGAVLTKMQARGHSYGYYSGSYYYYGGEPSGAKQLT